MGFGLYNTLHPGGATKARNMPEAVLTARWDRFAGSKARRAGLDRRLWPIIAIACFPRDVIPSSRRSLVAYYLFGYCGNRVSDSLSKAGPALFHYRDVPAVPWALRL